MTEANHVTWEQALEFTLLEMRVGALPWHIKDDVMEQEWNDLAGSFEKHHADWPAVRNKILRLARYQGALAALIQEIIEGPETGPGFVSYSSLRLAAWFVQLACPAGSGASDKLRGKHCLTIPVGDLHEEDTRRAYARFIAAAPLSDWQKLLGLGDD